MTVQQKRRSFPKIPLRNWWGLRARFNQAVPTKVDPDYLQAVLRVGPGHAQNLIPQLGAVGLIDDDGKPTELAMEWRLDDTYPQACAKILEAVYPQGLRDALPPPHPERKAVEDWFMRNAEVGRNAARQMAALYLLLCEADPTRAEGRREAGPKTTSRSQAAGSRRSVDVQAPSRPSSRPRAKATETSAPAWEAQKPVIHVAVQVYVPPEASADQIDQIFSSMAKHLYRRHA